MYNQFLHVSQHDLNKYVKNLRNDSIIIMKPHTTQINYASAL